MARLVMTGLVMTRFVMAWLVVALVVARTGWRRLLMPWSILPRTIFPRTRRLPPSSTTSPLAPPLRRATTTTLGVTLQVLLGRVHGCAEVFCHVDGRYVDQHYFSLRSDREEDIPSWSFSSQLVAEHCWMVCKNAGAAQKQWLLTDEHPVAWIASPKQLSCGLH